MTYKQIEASRELRLYKEDQGRITAALFFLYFQDAGDQKRC
jgi:hypothetical protein